VDPVQAAQVFLDAIEERIQSQVAPLHDYMNAHQERAALAAGEERAQELLAELGEGVESCVQSTRAWWILLGLVVPAALGRAKFADDRPSGCARRSRRCASRWVARGS
jgi:hypothetical protein